MGCHSTRNDNQKIPDGEIDNILNSIKDWIGNVDTKISFLLTVSCIFMGYILEKDIVLLGDWNVYLKYWWIISLLTISLILSLSSIILFVSALKATNNHSTTNYNSVIFSGDIANNASYDEYNRRLARLTPSELLNDKKKQIYINACIYTLKIKKYNLGLRITVVTIIIYAIYKILTVELGL